MKTSLPNSYQHKKLLIAVQPLKKMICFKKMYKSFYPALERKDMALIAKNLRIATISVQRSGTWKICRYRDIIFTCC